MSEGKSKITCKIVLINQMEGHKTKPLREGSKTMVFDHLDDPPLPPNSNFGLLIQTFKNIFIVPMV